MRRIGLPPCWPVWPCAVAIHDVCGMWAWFACAGWCDVQAIFCHA
ncbi:hypothetical protein DLM_3837 [Aquitalea magnusonii]|uniref:Uncharacterized protein n=1 Tax=Aquitalea magnusonii TaxID=332411 RepID=A0A3G9GTE0_9NEIS|nr:hypothetical protein DLM_3837 [Aquitalea magnusonii]